MTLDQELQTKEPTMRDVLGKWDVYREMTGRDWWNRESLPTLSFGEYDPVTVSSDNMDKLYLVAKKFERIYNRRTNPAGVGEQYYGRSLELIEAAYLAQDVPAFQEGVEELLSSIVHD